MMMWHFGSAGWWFESSEGSSSPWKINLLKDRFVVNSLRDIPLKCCRLVPAEGVCIINLVSSGTLLCLDEVRTPQSTQNYPLSISLYLYKITLHFPNYFSLSLIPVFSPLKIEFLMFVLHYIGEKLKEVLFENFIFEWIRLRLYLVYCQQKLRISWEEFQVISTSTSRFVEESLKWFCMKKLDWLGCLDGLQ